MAIGTAAALGIGLAANAGLGAWGASKQAGAAKDAANTQVASANEAKAELRPLYEQSIARLDPYAALGGGALGKLGALSGVTPLAANAGAVGRDAQGNPLGPINGSQGPLNMSDPRVQHLAQGGSLIDPEMRAPMSALGGGGRSGYQTGEAAVPRGGSSFQTSKMLKVQAPTGEIREFPADQAAYFAQRGAQIVS